MEETTFCWGTRSFMPSALGSDEITLTCAGFRLKASVQSDLKQFCLICASTFLSITIQCACGWMLLEILDRCLQGLRCICVSVVRLNAADTALGPPAPSRCRQAGRHRSALSSSPPERGSGTWRCSCRSVAWHKGSTRLSALGASKHHWSLVTLQKTES